MVPAHLTAGVRVRWLIVGLLGILCIAPGCGKKQASKPHPEEAAAPYIPGGDLQGRYGLYGVVFYYTPEPDAPAESTARELCAKHLPEFVFSTDAKAEGAVPLITFYEEMAPLQKFPVPEDSYFQHAGRGLSAEDADAIQATSRATVLTLLAPRDKVWPASRAFTELVHAFAVKTGAFIWDSATRECFSAAAWKEGRLDTWPADELVPNLSRHLTIHLYQPEDDNLRVRAITLGMEKFALPDVVLERLIRSDSRSAGNLLNLLCQSLAENQPRADGSRHVIRFADIKNAELRKMNEESVLEGGTGEVSVALVQGKPLEGDPDNRLIETRFPHSAGDNEDERREAAFATIWGTQDTIRNLEHSADVLAASERARSRLPELQKMVAEGLPAGARVVLKSRYERDDKEGNEWMWAEVLDWPKEGKVSGTLLNKPVYIAALKAGARVEVEPEEIFDYLLVKPDGTQEGDETGKFIEQQAAEPASGE